MKRDNKLEILDFTSSIRSESINYNFSIVEEWIERERLRTGGWGIAEGFDMSYPDNDFCIHITEGVLITKEGKELFIEDAIVGCDPPDYEVINEIIPVFPDSGGADGRIVLKYTPYSPSKPGLIDYESAPGNAVPKTSELSITNQASRRDVFTPKSIHGNVIHLSYVTINKKANVVYNYADDRIDAIVLTKEGTYKVFKGLNSTNPSKVHINFDDYFLIGFVHWKVGLTITAEFITIDRKYRPVYTNKDNILFLNGKEYKGYKFIFFSEPEDPEENDVWYDRKTNTLMVYVDGQWRIMNDNALIPTVSVKIWDERTCPDDLQTFMFDIEKDMNIMFIPGSNALNIIIDQGVVMKDQYEEIYIDEEGVIGYGTIPDTSKKSFTGCGFRLLYPLDKPANVQVNVTHMVYNGAVQSIFQKAAIFVDENRSGVIDSLVNPDNIFKTMEPFAIGRHQLELFVDGISLDYPYDYIELTETRGTVTDTDYDTLSHYIQITKPGLLNGQQVSYRLSRYVWDYKQLHTFVFNMEQEISDLSDATAATSTALTALTSNTKIELDAIKARLTAVEAAAASIANYRLKSDKLKLDDMDQEIKDRMIKNTETIFIEDAFYTEEKVIADVTNDDLIIVSYICANESRQLIEGSIRGDYVVIYNSADKTAVIKLLNNLDNSSAKVIITVIRIGL